jgi:DNA-binding NtrC family response regulator
MAHTVLISVSQQGLLYQIRDFLHGAGHRVMEAASDDAVLQILDESCSGPDLLLIDVHSHDAHRLARQAVLRRPGLKVLLISGEPEYITRELVPYTEVGFLERPFAWCDLKSKIDELMGTETLEARPDLSVTALF